MKRAVALIAVALALAPACARQNERRDELSAALYRTETLPRTYTYSARTEIPFVPRGGTESVARVVIEDDYRYRVDAFQDGELVATDIVVDDARALRAKAEKLVERLDEGQMATVLSIDAVPAEIRAEILDGKWLLDRHGANSLFDRAGASTPGSQSPADQVLGVLQDVRSAMGEAAAVLVFNPESQDYRPKFDPFPRPSDGVIRYDLVPPVLTPRDPTTASGRAQQLPGPRFFRRMSVYVEAGVVREIRERISIEDMLNDPRSRLAARIGDYGISLDERASVQDQAAQILETLNATAARLQQPPVLPVDLLVRFASLRPGLTVRLPEDATRGSLAGVRENAQILYETPG